MTNEARWHRWMRDGQVTTGAWVFVLLLDIGLTVSKNPAPEVHTVLAALTGLLVSQVTSKSKIKEDDDDA